MSKKNKVIKEPQEIQLPPLWKNILLGIALIFTGLFFFHKIIFINADLGRHIKNGELLLSDFSFSHPLLFSNYYSYSEPGFPVINHHWGSGVIFYLLWKYFDFSGLTLFHVLLNVAAAFVFFKIAEKKSNFILAFFCLILAVPLLASRTEVRPEAFSYLFTGIAYYVFSRFRKAELPFKTTLFILLPLQLLWVNLHLFFVMGLFIAGVFWLDALIKKQALKKTSILFAGMIFLCFINPSGVSGFLEPFMILREYGYMIAENQSIFFMQDRFPESTLYIHFEVLFILALGIFLYLLYKKRSFGFNPSFIVFLVFSTLSFKMIRGIPLWGLFFIPFTATVLEEVNKAFWIKRATLVLRSFLIAGIAVVFYGLVSKHHYYSPFKGISGMGLIENVNRSAEFIRSTQIEGPVFNNYDIGSYFIFNLFPKYKVFVDNRPEAYSVEFFKNVYEPMQEKEEKWQELNRKYGFNCIYYFRHDNTTHGQPFLIRRINDAEWAPVFVDDFTIVFLKRNEKNEQLIRTYELPRSMFSSVPQGGE